MTVDNGVGEKGGIGTMAGEAGGGSAGGKPVKDKPAKGKAPKKSKAKSALASHAFVAADREEMDSVAAESMPVDPVLANMEVTDLDLPTTVPVDWEVAAGDDAIGSDDPESDGVGTKTRRPLSTWRQWVRSNLLLVCGGIFVVALSVALAISLLALGNQDAVGSSRTSALAAARTDAVQLASYNYRELGRDFGVVVAKSTPSFRRRFTESSDALKTTLTKYKATAKASVVSAGLVSASTSRAVVLVFLNQKIANSQQAKPTTDRSQVEITLVSSGGRWLIDQVTLL